MKQDSSIRRLMAMALALALLMTMQGVARAEETDEEQGFFGTLWGIIKYVPETIYDGGAAAVEMYRDFIYRMEEKKNKPAPASTPTPRPTVPPNVKTVDPVMPGEWSTDLLPPDAVDFYTAWGTKASSPEAR